MRLPLLLLILNLRPILGFAATDVPVIVDLRDGSRLLGEIRESSGRLLIPGDSLPNFFKVELPEGLSFEVARAQVARILAPGAGMVWIEGQTVEMDSAAAKVTLRSGSSFAATMLTPIPAQWLDSLFIVDFERLQTRLDAAAMSKALAVNEWSMLVRFSGKPQQLSLQWDELHSIRIGQNLEPLDFSGIKLQAPHRVVARESFLAPEFGVVWGSPVPMALLAGVRSRSWAIRLSGLGHADEPQEYWWGTKISALASWKAAQHGFIDAGVGYGYFWAQAPDSLGILTNRLLGGYHMYELQWDERMDIGVECGVSLYGFRAEYLLPVWHRGNGERRDRWIAKGTPWWSLGWTWVFD